MKTWLITGASSGFGQAFANAALEHGDSVVATFRNAAQAKAFEAGAPGAALGLVMDVTDSRAVEAGIAAGLERFGRIDVLVNNAGYALRAPIEQTSDQEALDQLNVNAVSYTHLDVYKRQVLDRSAGFAAFIDNGIALANMRRARFGHGLATIEQHSEVVVLDDEAVASRDVV